MSAINTDDVRPIDFTIDNVPDEIQDVRLAGPLYIEILKSGNMVSTGNELRDLAQSYKIKNHVAYWAHVHKADITTERHTIRFSMNVVNPDASFSSTEARYAPSDRSSVLSFGSTFSASVESTSWASDEASPTASLLSRDGSSIMESGSPRDAASVFSTSGSSGDAASVFAFLPQGAPAPGSFDIKVRSYTGESHSAVALFALPIIGVPTLRDLLNSLRTRHMLPFFFPKLGFSYLGCRHFASEAIEAWKQDQYINDRCTITGSVFRDLIGIRYTPLDGLPADLANSEEEISEEEEGIGKEGSGKQKGSGGKGDGGSGGVISGMRKTPNPIDKGIFPSTFESLTVGYPFTLVRGV